MSVKQWSNAQQCWKGFALYKEDEANDHAWLSRAVADHWVVGSDHMSTHAMDGKGGSYDVQ